MGWANPKKRTAVTLLIALVIFNGKINHNKRTSRTPF